MDAHFITRAWLAAWQKKLCSVHVWQEQLTTLLEPLAITAAELLLLAELQRARETGRTQIELARATTFSPAQVSGLIEALATRGWVTTVRSPYDRRRVICSLTTAGQTELQRVFHLLGPVAEADARDTLRSPEYREDAA